MDTLAETMADEDLGTIQFQGVNSSSAFASAADIFVEQDGAAGATNIPGRILFDVGTNAANPTERMRIDSTGVKVGFGAPAAKLHVDQFNTTAAIPVLTLDQADVDHVLIKVIATAEAAGADRTLVADSDYGTPGALTGWIQIEVTDIGNRIADGDYYIPFYAVPT